MVVENEMRKFVGYIISGWNPSPQNLNGIN